MSWTRRQKKRFHLTSFNPTFVDGLIRWHSCAMSFADGITRVRVILLIADMALMALLLRVYVARSTTIRRALEHEQLVSLQRDEALVRESVDPVVLPIFLLLSEAQLAGDDALEIMVEAHATTASSARFATGCVVDAFQCVPVCVALHRAELFVTLDGELELEILRIALHEQLDEEARDGQPLQQRLRHGQPQQRVHQLRVRRRKVDQYSDSVPVARP